MWVVFENARAQIFVQASFQLYVTKRMTRTQEAISLLVASGTN